MTTPGRRPCAPWSDVTTCDDALGDIDDAIFDRALLIATELLWALSGRRFGECSATVRPCQRADPAYDRPGVSWWGNGYGGWGRWPWMDNWPTFRALQSQGYGCGSSCACSTLSEIRLPRRPVTAVQEVKVDGVVLTAGTDYRVDDWRWLVRLGGLKWPVCQDLLLPDTAVGTFSVAFSYGPAAPAAGVYACERLACEIAKAMIAHPDCNLPERVQTVTRQGITVGFIDPMTFLDKGRTGIYEVDLFLRSYNPNGLSRRSSLHRADAGTPARRVGT